MLRVPLVVVGGWAVGVVSGDVWWRIENTRGWKVLESNLWVKVSEFQTYKIKTSGDPPTRWSCRSFDRTILENSTLNTWHIRLKTHVRVVFWKKKKHFKKHSAGRLGQEEQKKWRHHLWIKCCLGRAVIRYETDVLTLCADGEPRWGCREEEVPPPCRLWFPQSSAVRVCKAIRRVADCEKDPENSTQLWSLTCDQMLLEGFPLVFSPAGPQCFLFW